MVKTRVTIEGMMCKNCEKHMLEAMKKNLAGAKKISVSHKTGSAEFVSDAPIEETAIKEVVEDAGYTFVSCETV
ncbi:MAG: heavy-metal-associated domain-containing protein [Lachnospiraceae bacterium]|nr:heavy-metal-associated domain-containing protein [Lachnospiraceae bacterium]